ncbi:MAG: lipid-A-disaccharide synthase [Pseudomonadales bacterium]|nr:lipid-A-disaccharide synthase [Pseudomonadales bacterium]
MKRPLRVGILAGELSGDVLGAGLMAALRQKEPEVTFVGIGGPQMMAQGLLSRVPMERLSVMGLVAPLLRLRELLAIRRQTIEYFVADPPDVFIGIDAPDFNLGMAEQLKQHGIPCVHYVSPSVWAWRRRRIRKIARSVDLMLTLFPFEAAFYEEHGVPVVFTGHPLADDIPLNIDVRQARLNLNLDPERRVLALLPGSRQDEVGRLALPFLQAAARCLRHWPDLQIVIPCASMARKEQIQAIMNSHFPTLDLILSDGRSRDVMAAADALLLASGTAALEGLLLKKPMLVCYRMAWLSYWILYLLVKIPWFSLPNLLAGKKIVAEYLQNEVNADTLEPPLSALLARRELPGLLEEYETIHQQLRRGASATAARAVLELLCKKQKPGPENPSRNL